jgi:hypothetical protein
VIFTHANLITDSSRQKGKRARRRGERKQGKDGRKEKGKAGNLPVPLVEDSKKRKDG